MVRSQPPNSAWPKVVPRLHSDGLRMVSILPAALSNTSVASVGTLSDNPPAQRAYPPSLGYLPAEAAYVAVGLCAYGPSFPLGQPGGQRLSPLLFAHRPTPGPIPGPGGTWEALQR